MFQFSKLHNSRILSPPTLINVKKKKSCLPSLWIKSVSNHIVCLFFGISLCFLQWLSVLFLVEKACTPKEPALWVRNDDYGKLRNKGSSKRVESCSVTEFYFLWAWKDSKLGIMWTGHSQPCLFKQCYKDELVDICKHSLTQKLQW